MSSFRLKLSIYFVGRFFSLENIRIELAESKIKSRYFEKIFSIAFPLRFQISSGPVSWKFKQIAVSSKSYDVNCPYTWLFSGIKACSPLKKSELSTLATEKVLSKPNEKSNHIAATTWWWCSKRLLWFTNSYKIQHQVKGVQPDIWPYFEIPFVLLKSMIQKTYDESIA